MSLAITHFAVGMTLTALLLWLVAPTCRYRRSLAIAGGIWALVPDIYYVSPVYTAELRAIKMSIFGNVFWFHRSLDSFVKGRGSRRTAVVAVLVLLLVIIFVESVERPALETIQADE